MHRLLESQAPVSTNSRRAFASAAAPPPPPSAEEEGARHLEDGAGAAQAPAASG
jgi:hypothetical protein